MSHELLKMQVGCAVVTHNSAQHIPALLRSLAALPVRALVVVDSASTDDTCDTVSSVPLPFEAVVVRGPNEGYASGANRALRELLRINVELALLLNPDTVVERADLDGVVRMFEDDARLGSMCPVLVRPGGQTFDSLGLRLTPWGSVADHAQGEKCSYSGTHTLSSVIGPTGAGAVYRMSALAGLAGPFDERFFLYFEDADLALRLRRDGWRTVTSDLVTLEHRRGGLGGIRGVTASQAAQTALFHRQRSYELFVAFAPLSPWRRLLGRLASRLRRRLVARRLPARPELSFE